MERILLVGFEESEAEAIRSVIDVPVMAHMDLPQIVVDNGALLAQRTRGPGMLPISHVLFHGIYEDDLDFIAGLALWGGPCLPNPHALLDSRLKSTCLVKALRFTRFGTAPRGYVSPHTRFATDTERVAKWGNWHCGENKERFTRVWESENPCLIEPFLIGESVRVLLIGEQYWQIHLAGDDWRKSIHAPNATFMEIEPELLADSRAIQAGFGLELLANDYIIGVDGSRHLLEVNPIPNVTYFQEIWHGYRSYCLQWLNQNKI
jgi:hypothetical protein